VRVGHDELILDGGADDVPRARRFAVAALRGGRADALVGDVELVVSELVTNALLHAGAPASLRVFIPAQRPESDEVVVRVEVRDPLRSSPIRAVASTESMTGRGITLIEALASSWGVEHDGTGKVVWSELSTLHHSLATELDSPDFDIDIDSLLADWDDEPTDEQRVTVRLGDVPTDLLLAAKAHVDNLVREFTLAAAGAESGHSAAVPLHLAALVETVVHQFAEPRLAMKRQAVKAAAAGAPRTDVILTLTAASVASGLAYIEALDQADAYARAARLLTMETPAQHRIFRRWYVETLMSQVHAAVRGEVVPALTFEDRLLLEVARLAAAQRAIERAARLQEVTAALGAATTPADVAQVVVHEGVAALGASGGSVLVPTDDRRLSLPGAYGYNERLMDHLRNQLNGDDRPHASWLTEPVWIESRQERDELFPDLAEVEPQTNALCTVPLAVGGRVLGALRFSFDSPRLFDDEQRRFVFSLAAQTAQALDRSALFLAERAARSNAEALADRLGRLQAVTAALTTATNVEQVGDIIVTATADALGASVAGLSLLRDDGRMEMVRYQGGIDPRRDPALRGVYTVEAGTPPGDAIASRQAVIVRGPDELARRYPDLADQFAGENSRVVVVVPLRFGLQVLGVLGLSYEDHQAAVDEDSVVAFLQTIGDGAAQAIQNFRALAAASTANDKLSFLADASAIMSSSLDYSTTLTNVSRLMVPRIADLCAIHLLDQDGRVNTATICHIPSEQLAAVQRRQEEFPVDIDEPEGVGYVIRTGHSQLIATITDAHLVAGAPDDARLAADRALGLSSVLVVPMVGRSGVIGAIALVYADSDRHYDEADQAMAEDLGRRAAVAVENAAEFDQQTGRLAAIEERRPQV
jgi:GAF domain-containing protein/anti-sigma regulatory factor (Ser/Thr protein kinase)